MTGETNRGKVVPVNPPELVVLPDGSCIVDGVPTDFVALLRDKVAAKTALYSSARLRREFKAMDVDSNGRLGAKEFRRFLEPYNLNLVRAATVGLVCDCCRDSDCRPLLRTEPRRAEASIQALRHGQLRLRECSNGRLGLCASANLTANRCCEQIDYMEFISQICPPNYHRKTVKEVSPRGEVMDKVAMQVSPRPLADELSRRAALSHGRRCGVQGIASMVWEPPRGSMTPKVLAPFQASKNEEVSPAPLDSPKLAAMPSCCCLHKHLIWLPFVPAGPAAAAAGVDAKGDDGEQQGPRQGGGAARLRPGGHTTCLARLARLAAVGGLSGLADVARTDDLDAALGAARCPG